MENNYDLSCDLWSHYEIALRSDLKLSVENVFSASKTGCTSYPSGTMTYLFESPFKSITIARRVS